jgi:hypothetical protein
MVYSNLHSVSRKLTTVHYTPPQKKKFALHLKDYLILSKMQKELPTPAQN